MDHKDDFKKLLSSLPYDMQEILKKALEESSATTEEQFLAEIMIGECPYCKSNNTKDCEEVDGIEDCTVGLCMRCGYLWCSECGRSLIHNINCKHWNICDRCDQADEFGICDIDPLECDTLNKELDEGAKGSL
jgi:hypothetical protein